MGLISDIIIYYIIILLSVHLMTILDLNFVFDLLIHRFENYFKTK